MSLLKSLKDASVGKVLAVYASASFVVLQAIDLFRDNLELPEWIFGGALVLLVIGLPIIVATAIVQHHDFESKLIEKNFTWRRAIGGGVVAFAFLMVAGFFYARDRFGGNEELDANLVAVFPFRVTGANASLHYLKEGMVDLLAAKLSGESGPRAADPRAALAAWRRIDSDDPETEQLVRAARSIGARRILIGEVVGSDAQLTVNASVTDTRTGRKVQHSVTGPIDSLQQRVDELTAVLLSLDAGEPRDRLASLTSTSLPALRSYLLGEEAYRRANFSKAGGHYLEALAADSTFAVAGLGVIVAGFWAGSITAAQNARAERLAWTFRDRLPDLDLLKLKAFVGANYPWPQGTVEGCSYWQQVVDRAPDRAEAWHMIGDCIYHYWPYTPSTDHYDKARAAFEKSLALDSTFMPNVEHLVRIAAEKRDTAAVEKLVTLFLAADTASETAAQVRWLRAFVRGAPRDELLELARQFPREMATFGMHIVDDLALADSLVMLNTAHDPPGLQRSIYYQTLGRHGMVAKSLEDANAISPGSSDLAVVINALYSDADTIAALRSLAELDRIRSEPEPADARARGIWAGAPCVTEQWRLWRGDASQTDAVIARLRDKRAIAAVPTAADPRRLANQIRSAEICATMIEAIRATVQHRPDAMALAVRVDSISASFPQYSASSRSIRIVASRLFELNGDNARARTAVNRYNVGIVPGFHETQWLQSARLSAKLGDREAAIRDYQKYLGLRARADGAAVASTEQARRELNAIVAAGN